MSNFSLRSFVSKEVLHEGNATKDARQAEWDAVRSREPEAPKPDPNYDSRTLYERLKEQRDKKEAEFTEATKLSNLVKKLDDDEIDYLASLEDTQLQQELEKRELERSELECFRMAVQEARQQPSPDHPTATLHADFKKVERKPTKGAARKETLVKSGVLVRKRSRTEEDKPESETSPSKVTKTAPQKDSKSSKSEAVATNSSKNAPALTSLIDYGSDEESD